MKCWQECSPSDSVHSWVIGQKLVLEKWHFGQHKSYSTAIRIENTSLGVSDCKPGIYFLLMGNCKTVHLLLRSSWKDLGFSMIQ